MGSKVDNSFPKWVAPHSKHIVRSGADGMHISTPAFPEVFVDREEQVTVLVHNAEEEKAALADPHPQEDLFSAKIANLFGHNSKARDDDADSA